MIGQLSLLLFLLVFCDGRHREADRMLPNERTTLDDCRSRFNILGNIYRTAPAYGTSALIKEFAHMGAIGWTQPDGKVLWLCGGTLIRLDFVLTAAHCVVDHSDVRPDIVRFGDLNLETDDDNEYAQQMKIVEIHRYPLHRFAAKYHDIALMKLESPVKLHDTVCPACLWLDPDIRFTELVATGWGSTGYFEERTPSLLKVSLKPMETTKCETYYASESVRGLNSGLHENHLCAYDEKMDTCEGDSGGPLQVKLLHKTYLTPFVVAITSFGLPCGSSKPGVYTKVAPYHDWTVATMRKSGTAVEDEYFNATFCALRFQKFREDINSDAWNKTHVRVYHTKPDLIHVHKPPSYLVKLMWNGSEGLPHCFGTIIDENTVLTVADCANHQGISPSSVVHPDGILDISKVIIHPKYNPLSGYYNIAILRLHKLYSFINIRPACTEYEDYPLRSAPDTVFGIGRQDIYNCINFPECINSTAISLKVYTQLKNKTDCLIPRESKQRFADGITSELFCAGFDRFLVPGACSLNIGSSLSTTDHYPAHVTTLDGEIIVYGDLYPPLDGLVQTGRDCGYGEHLIATKIRSHLEWMERVLLPKSSTANAVLFLEANRREGDSCMDQYGLLGKCTSISRCQRMWKKYEISKEATFCSSSSVICCPQDDIDKAAWSEKHSLLAKCQKLVNVLLPDGTDAPMVRILDSTNQYVCMGAIVSDRTVLTSASCVGPKASLSVQPLGNIRVTIRVQKIISHTSYNSTDYSNDIALLKVSQSLTWSPRLHPACLWTNKTHSPLIVEMLHPFNTSDTIIKFTELLTMYNSDCQRTHPYRLRDSHICVKYPYRKYTCLPSHSMLRWEDSDGVPYLIGLSTGTRNCQSWYYMTFSRVTAFVDWIVDNIDVVELMRSFRVQ